MEAAAVGLGHGVVLLHGTSPLIVALVVTLLQAF